MTDYLPNMTMPSDPVDPVDPDPLDADPLTGEENPQFVYSDEDEEEEVIVDPIVKEKIEQEEIFGVPKVKPIKSPPEGKPVKKKKVLTPAQLESLAAAREKGLATRKRNAEIKKQRRLEEKEDKKIHEELRQKDRRRMKKKLEDPDDEPAPRKEPQIQIVEKERVVEKGYSQQQLDDAVAAAVELSVQKVEVLRKNRKAVKKQEQAKEKHDAKVFKEINSALKKPDIWDSCFM
tara:strand:+ start:171 stop:869 length:699 start_codon:yes stop_codon:yes gene_type:complete